MVWVWIRGRPWRREDYPKMRRRNFMGAFSFFSISWFQVGVGNYKFWPQVERSSNVKCREVGLFTLDSISRHLSDVKISRTPTWGALAIFWAGILTFLVGRRKVPSFTKFSQRPLEFAGLARHWISHFSMLQHQNDLQNNELLLRKGIEILVLRLTQEERQPQRQGWVVKHFLGLKSQLRPSRLGSLGSRGINRPDRKNCHSDPLPFWPDEPCIAVGLLSFPISFTKLIRLRLHICSVSVWFGLRTPPSG